MTNVDDTSKNDEDLILVTGASGYVASHIVKQLLELGYRVRGTVRSLKSEKKVAPLHKLVDNPKHELELVEADLTDENSWLNAVKDCTHVLHTASPFPAAQPKNENELIEPAVNGTLFVFKACVQEGSKVQRLVLTSSIASILDDIVENKLYNENNWPDSSKLNPYAKSKTLAEKAAWNFVEERKKNGEKCFELAVINPSFVMGPLLHDTACTSTQPITKLMLNELPLLPNITFCICDVRDVALAHIRAMKRDEAVNNRHIVTNSNECYAMKEWALILKEEFGSKNYKIPTKVAPNFLIKVFGIFDPLVKMIVPSLGKEARCDNSALKKNLLIEPIPLKRTLVEMAYSMIERGMLPKKY